ncbi:hypothetical protein DF182_31820 [Chitinophaga flava]|uniref:Uncharacterized protein n=1 Tax=Chitinophaga flava TaxID=2259036 RepID=A0A365XQ26_9BACT|nr:hypothetical protein DF182_31820 [Chitinophaga flava]
MSVAAVLAILSGSSLSAAAPVQTASIKQTQSNNRGTLSISVFWTRWLPLPLTFIPSPSLIVNTTTGQTVRANADGHASIDVQVGDVLKIDEFRQLEHVVTALDVQAGFMLISLGELPS